jgi:hypothetical protein
MTALASSNHNITIFDPSGTRSFDHNMANFPPPHEIESFFHVNWSELSAKGYIPDTKTTKPDQTSPIFVHSSNPLTTTIRT